MVSALNESGQPVDWVACYKIPKLSGGVQCDAASGFEYCYTDSTLDGKMSKSAYRLDEQTGSIHTILAQLTQPGAGYILYNDERPDGKPDNGDLGHTKGVLAWDVATDTGFWLLHSWPLFPVLGAVTAPTPIYGQTFLCLSLTRNSLNSIAAQMLEHQEPQVYASSFGTPDFSDPLFELSSGRLTPKPAPSFDSLDLQTIGGMPFKVLAKNREWNSDYWNQVEETLGVSMNVETWIRGPIAPTADTDGIHKTFDVKYVTLGPLGIHYAWPETSDHAKWGISADPSQPWIVIGDINRMISQRKRGGGGIAFQNLNLWSSLSKTDLVIAPPGMTRTQTHTHIRATHSKGTS